MCFALIRKTYSQKFRVLHVTQTLRVHSQVVRVVTRFLLTYENEVNINIGFDIISRKSVKF